jgi:hypothetical protein
MDNTLIKPHIYIAESGCMKELWIIISCKSRFFRLLYYGHCLRFYEYWGFFPLGWDGRVVRLTTHSHLEPMIKLVLYFHSPLVTSRHVQEKSYILPLRLSALRIRIFIFVSLSVTFRFVYMSNHVDTTKEFRPKSNQVGNPVLKVNRVTSIGLAQDSD